MTITNCNAHFGRTPPRSMPYQRSHVAVDGFVLYLYCQNGDLFRATVTFAASMIFDMTSLVTACLTF